MKIIQYIQAFKAIALIEGLGKGSSDFSAFYRNNIFQFHSVKLELFHK